jgi:4-amino-4-deoxy-L-arabinose transferase-like glycosyltransferase
MSAQRTHLVLIGVLFLATRLLFVLSPAGRMGDADQAIFGMMAQKIAMLEEFPIYAWEAHYAGAPVCYVAAAIFKLFGSGFVQLRLAMLLITASGFFLFYFIYSRLFNPNPAFLGVLLLIFCPYFVLNLTTAALGGYGESFVGAALIILISWKISENTMPLSTGLSLFLLGLICGFFLYVQFYAIPAILAFAIPAIAGLSKDRIRLSGKFLLGGLVGISPLIFYNLLNRGGTFTRSAGWILSVGRNDLAAPWGEVIGKIFANKLSYFETWFLNLPLTTGKYVVPAAFGGELQTAGGFMLIALFLIYTLRFLKKDDSENLSDRHRSQFAFYIVVFILFQWFAGLNADRHFMSLYFLVPIVIFSLMGQRLGLRKASFSVALILVAFQLVDWNREFRTQPFDPGPVARIMEREGIEYFYATYWTCYPIVFSSECRLIGSPAVLPRNQPFTDRRPQYTKLVNQSRSSAFVFRSNEENLKRAFLSFIESRRIAYEALSMSGASVFYHLSKPVGISYDDKNRKNVFHLK